MLLGTGGLSLAFIFFFLSFLVETLFHWVDQAGPEPTEIHLHLLGLKVCATMSDLVSTL